MITQSYHNTNKLPLFDRIDAEQKARSQEKIILDYFRQHPGELFSPWGILNILFDGNPKKINSVRRAMTNLSDPIRHITPKLKKTPNRVKGEAGAPEHLWTLNTQRCGLCFKSPCHCVIGTSKPRQVDFSPVMGEYIRIDSERLSGRNILASDGLD